MNDTAPLAVRQVAVLGTGIMGGAMARRAAAAGLGVRGWSVPLADAERLRPLGVTPAASPAEAVLDADLVVTAVPDAAAIESFATGPDGFLDAMKPDAVWLQSSTVGPEPAERLLRLAAAHGVSIIDGPVLGSAGPAARGELVVLASGEDALIERCAPFWSAVARRVVRVGPAGSGSRLKIVINHWIMGCVAVLAETLALADALDVDGHRLLEVLAGTEVDMGYAHLKGSMMLKRSYEDTQGSLAVAAKDARLAHVAARGAGLTARVSGAAAELMAAALAMRGPGEDMAAAFEAAARRE